VGEPGFCHLLSTLRHLRGDRQQGSSRRAVTPSNLGQLTGSTSGHFL